MKKVIHKLFFAWDFEKQEKWLNEMSAKGLNLDGVGFCKYIFEEGMPGEYIYRLELLEKGPTHAESEQYIRFLEDTGVEYVGSITRWVYFRKKAADGEFDLFSDIDSRIKHLNRLTSSFGVLAIAEFLISLSNLIVFFSNGYRPNMYIGLLTIAAGLLLTFGFCRIAMRTRKLKKERILRE